MNSFNKNIPEIEKIIGYVFQDKSLLRQAFTRSSYCNEAPAEIKLQSNEVLEFFGDSALSLSIVSYLINEKTERYDFGIKTDLKEGDFSNIRSKLSDKKNLAENVKRLGLEKYLLLGEGDEKLGIRHELSVMEDLFEGIIGAIYIDSGYSVTAVMRSVGLMLDIAHYLNGKAPAPIQSYKNALQEWCADKKRRLPAPRYEKLDESGPDHNKTYTCACYIGDKLMGRGVGKNLKLAEAAAAEEALRRLSE